MRNEDDLILAPAMARITPAPICEPSRSFVAANDSLHMCRAAWASARAIISAPRSRSSPTAVKPASSRPAMVRLNAGLLTGGWLRKPRRFSGFGVRTA